jgi:Mg-chelatase subunit ChlD
MARRRKHCVLFFCVGLLLLQATAVQAGNAPYVNPLGDLDAYAYLDFMPGSDLWDPWDLSYWDEEEEYVPVILWGDYWYLEVPESSLQELRQYLAGLDSTILVQNEEEILAQVQGPAAAWWVRAFSWGDDSYELTVIREQDPPAHLDDREEEHWEEEYWDEDDGYEDLDWESAELPLPLINPLGDLEAYALFTYDSADLFELAYYNTLGEAKTCIGWGERWSFEVPFEDRDHPLGELEEHVRALGGQVLESSANMLRAVVMDGDIHWQAIAQVDSWQDVYALEITKEILLQPGRQVTLHPQAGEETIGLCTESDGLQHRSLVVELTGGEFSLDGWMFQKYGEYEREWYQWFPIVHERTPLHILDFIPQEAGKTVWIMSLAEETRPEQITVSIKESVPLQPVKMGEQLGVLRIIGADAGEVSVTPSHDIGVAHPDYQQGMGDRTAEGDYVFYLPAGYWDVEQFMAGYPPVKARLVPVNAGEITVFTMPSVTQVVFEESAALIEASDALELSRHRIQGDQGALDFALRTPLPPGAVIALENTEISEGGLMGKILSLEPVITPPDIVLLLDSSGSMRAQMEQTLVAAREFINSLGDDTWIQVIDFDTTPKLLQGTEKADVLASLSTVRADGATCLYDSILEGLALLQDKKRPILVLFTDGVDANWDDTGPGSVATLPQVREAVLQSEIPLYTIGFGAGHDKTVLEQLAEISSGSYYPAADQNALQEVFQSINKTLSSTYHLVYQRPAESDISDVPVVSIMIDTSGSMDMSPEEGDDCGYRMQKVKNILHDFILGLPPQTLLQIQSFSWGPSIGQSLTLDKASALHAVGGLWAGGGTDIIGSMNTAYQTLRHTPSKNKTLVYITDAAIAAEQEQETVDQILQGFAESDVKSLWMGVGMEHEEALFAQVAEKSKGHYIVTEDHLELAAALDQVLAQVKTAVEDASTVQVRLVVKGTDQDHTKINYIGTLDIPYVKMAKSGEIVGPELASYYGTGVAADLEEMKAFGLSEGSLVSRYIPLDAAGHNLGLDMQVTGGTASNRLAGLWAPDGMQFISIDLTLKNILEAQEVEVDSRGNNHPASWLSSVGSSGRKEFRVPQYLIPSLSSHLYLGWNNDGLYPVSEASWIAPQGLLVPGEISLTLNPEETLQGSLVFLVPEEPMAQMSLHFYDTAYGHLQLDLIGTAEHREIELEMLPAAEPARLSDVFELRVTAVQDLTEIGPVTARKSNLFRLVELDLTSKVQALLDINPQEVFSLRVLSDEGVFFLPLHPLTKSVPLGFSEARMVAPGSFNKVRFVFEIPRALAASASELFVDLREDDVLVPITGLAEKVEVQGEPHAAEGIELYLNHLGRVKELEDDGVDYVVADVTFVDAPDGLGTELYDGLSLVRDDYTGTASEVDLEKLVSQGGLGDFAAAGDVLYKLLPSEVNSRIVLGFDDPVIKDGATRRALVVFEIPSGGEEHQWTLQSDIFTSLQKEVPEQDYAQQELLSYKTESGLDLESSFELELEMAIALAIREYQARQAAQGELLLQERMDLSGKDDQELTILPPMAVASGALALEEIASLEQLLEVLRSLQWRPGTDSAWEARYAPAALLTQGWGTEADLAVLAEEVLQRLGYSTERSTVDLSEAGLMALGEASRVPAENLQLRQLPALKYWGQGAEGLLVLPFALERSELTEYVSAPGQLGEMDPFPLMAEISVSFDVVAKGGGFGDQFADFASILAGSEDGEEILRHELLSVELPLTELSQDPVDLVYVHGGGDLYTAVLETLQQRYVGEDALDTSEYAIQGAAIEISVADFRYTHRLDLRPEQAITEIAHTIAINSPDLPAEAAKQLQQIANTLHGSTDRPDSLSVLKWYTRSIINRFVAAQTETEQNLAASMDLVIGRTVQPRVIIVTVENDAPQGTIQTSIDLLNAANDIHSGDELTQRAFNLGAGLMASSLEAQALGSGFGVFEVWGHLPHDATMLWIDDLNKGTALEVLEAAGFGSLVRQRILETEGKVILIPLEQVIIDGTLRTAWLEMDPETYFTIGVLDSGEHGAMLESAVQNLLKEFTKYYVGAIVGVHSMMWGVCTFALEYAEYEEILAAAMEQSLAMAGQVKKALEELAKIDPRKVQSMMTKVESKSLAAINDFGKFAKDEATAYVKAKVEAIPKEEIKELLPQLSFVDGIIDGIELFAIYARP